MNPPYLVAATDVVYTINWNDGTDTTITADDLAAAGDQVTHVFPGMTSGNTVDISVDVNVGSISGSDTTYTTYTGVGSLSVTVDSITATTTAVTLTNDAANLGDTAQLQAAVTADVTELGITTGGVEFYEQVGTGATAALIDLGAGTLESPDVFVLRTPPLAAGDNNFIAVFSGDGFYQPSTSAALTVSIAGADDTLSIGGPSCAIAEGTDVSLSLPNDPYGNAITQWTINWGDGAPFGASSHAYGAPGTYTVIALGQSSAGYFEGITTVTVSSTAAGSAPSDVNVTVDNAEYSGADTEDGGSLAPDQLHVSFNGPAAAESYNVSIDWGDGSAATTFSLDPGQTSFDYPLQQYTANASYPIIVTVTDAEENSASNSSTPQYVTYSNSAPSGLTLSLDQTTVYAGDVGPTLSGSFTDLQPNIAHVVSIDWGDAVTTIDLDAGETAFTAGPHQYLSPSGSPYTVTATVTGMDGAVTASAATPVTVNAVSADGIFEDTDGSLKVLLPSDSDGHTLTVTQDSTSGDVTFTLDSLAPQTFADLNSIRIVAYGGSNSINAAGVNVPMTIKGGSGSDDITGGDGGNTIIGGAAGGNVIHAGAGGDTIYGGAAGGDTIYGGAGGDTIYGHGATPNYIYGGTGNETIYAGNGGDSILGGTGNNEIYGGAGIDDIDVSPGQNNWVQAGSGGATINGGAGSDWLFAGNGATSTYTIYGGTGTEKIYGGPGTNYLHAGEFGLDDIYGGTGTNYIYGDGQHDLLVGGKDAKNYIQPTADYSGGQLASVQVENSGGGLTSDGNIDSSGNPFDGDDSSTDPAEGDPSAWIGRQTSDTPGYCGLWTFNDFDSGARLGEDTTTPVAVYVTWDPTGIYHDTGTQWASNACYTVLLDGSPIYSVHNIGLGSPCGQTDSPEPGDRHWLRLGVWNVSAGSHLKVELTDYDYQSGDLLLLGDAMVHPIWPTVTLRPTNVAVSANVPAGHAGDYVDWVDADSLASIPVEGSGDRLGLQVFASIEQLYYSIPGATANDWKAVLPNIAGLDFWTLENDGTQLAADGDGNIIDSPLSQVGTGPFVGTYRQYRGTVYSSIDPSSSYASSGLPVSITDDANGPDGAMVPCALPVQAAVGSWTANDWSGSRATSGITTYTGKATADGSGCTLRQLAYDITGNGNDWTILKKANPGVKLINNATTEVNNHTEIDVSSLLKKLEMTLRDNVAAAANSRIYAKFPTAGQVRSSYSGMDEADVNSVFTVGGKGVFDCKAMANIVMARGLIKTLRSGEFDDIFQTISGMQGYYAETALALAATQKGDFLYFENDPAYIVGGRPRGFYPGENVIETQHGTKVELSTFAGWAAGSKMLPLSYGQWCHLLIKHFDKDPPAPATEIKKVPGYDGSAKFFDVAAVAKAIFNWRVAHPPKT